MNDPQTVISFPSALSKGQIAALRGISSALTAEHPDLSPAARALMVIAKAGIRGGAVHVLNLEKS